MSQGDDFGAEFLDRVLDRLGREHRAPFRLDGSHLAARAFGDLAQEMAEATEHGDQHPVARRDQRDQDRLDPGPRGAVDQERPVIGGLKQPPQERHGFVHVGGEGRVELAQQRHGHGAQHAGIGVDRPRAQQKPGWRIQLGREIRHGIGHRHSPRLKDVWVSTGLDLMSKRLRPSMPPGLGGVARRAVFGTPRDRRSPAQQHGESGGRLHGHDRRLSHARPLHGHFQHVLTVELPDHWRLAYPVAEPSLRHHHLSGCIVY